MEYYKQFLNEIEIAELQKLYENKTLKGAIKKVLLSELYYNGTLLPGLPVEPNQNAALRVKTPMGEKMSNEEIGEFVRALKMGIDTVELGFKALDEHFKPEKAPAQTTKKNIAR